MKFAKKNKQKFYPVLEPVIGKKEKAYVMDCLNSGWISSNGKYVKAFEEAFAKWNNTKHALAIANGTVSLHLILLVLGVTKNDEVIVPNLTYVASANAVLYVGAKPVFVDCEKSTFNIDPELIAQKITPRTKAIMVTHVWGNPCNMEKIMSIANKHNLPVIEDAAEAHGAMYQDKMVGTFGKANSYSFFGNKTITTGEGGMIVTNSSDLTEKISLLRNQGQHPDKRRYYHDCLAYNYRMTNMEAAVGLAQLEQINKFLKNKLVIHEAYKKLLSPLATTGVVRFQEATPGSAPSWWVTTIILESHEAEKVADKLRREGVDTRPFFYPMNKLPHLKQDGNFPNTEHLSSHGLILPSASNLKISDVKKICAVIISSLK